MKGNILFYFINCKKKVNEWNVNICETLFSITKNNNLHDCDETAKQKAKQTNK